MAREVVSARWLTMESSKVMVVVRWRGEAMMR